MAARQIHVNGRVQGVGYRVSLQDEARKRGISGWVRNRKDGAVEAVFAAPPELIDEMIAACRQGPRSGKVDGIEQRPATPAEFGLSRQAEIFSCLPTF